MRTQWKIKEKEDASAKKKKPYQIFFKTQSFPFYFGACDAMENTDKKDASAKFFLSLTKFSFFFFKGR